MVLGRARAGGTLGDWSGPADRAVLLQSRPGTGTRVLPAL